MSSGPKLAVARYAVVCVERFEAKCLHVAIGANSDEGAWNIEVQLVKSDNVIRIREPLDLAVSGLSGDACDDNSATWLGPRGRARSATKTCVHRNFASGEKLVIEVHGLLPSDGRVRT